ncbi:hypothetical protein AK812_SmicGene35132 [Symbiodinium microadriaticum]|uniref:Uncharacterized protein n=1 Tax=Symbiodinium microadriaticum TaxID=2951 RepID=A0A1Q9CM90_SYMMI|nr:hypothetical protein AK812_SmicGene35132 [Symbiodinium microadriaticum]
MSAVAAALADYAGQLSKNTSRTVAGVAQLFTMYVVPAKTFVEMVALKPFEVLLQEGVLVAFDEQEGHALFVSHQWLTSGHPDPKMEQFKILQDALKDILAGVSTVPASLGLEFLEGRGRTAVGGEMCGRPLFVWYDYLCCPQVEGKREEAILSLPAYVLQQMVQGKMMAFLMKGNFHKYRLIFALLRAHFAGLPKKPVENLVPGFVSKATDPADFFLAEYMHQNGFSSVTDRDAEGWTPLCYASLLGNPMLIYALLEHQADPNDAISQPSAFCRFASGTSGLQMCSFLGHNEALRQLIAHRADVTAANGSGAAALHWAAAGDNVEGAERFNALTSSTSACCGCRRPKRWRFTEATASW